MSRLDLEQALASVIDAESQVGLRWRPGEEIAPIAYRRWSTFTRRWKGKSPTLENRVLDLAKGLRDHFELGVASVPLSEYIHLAEILARVLEDQSPHGAE